MRREVVQKFLNLPGIAAVALMDGRSRPCFCGIDQALNFQQKEALALGIQQVVDTTPPGFKFFEFQFGGHQLYIYKLKYGIVLLVLTGPGLVEASYAEVLEQIKWELQKDAANTVATFRLLAGSTTSPKDYWQPGREVVSTLPKNDWATVQTFALSALKPQPETVSAVTLQQVITAMNQLSKLTSQYLGGTVVTNYWKITCPDVCWLQQFQVERSAQIHFSAFPPKKKQDKALAENSEPNLTNPVLTPDQQQWIQDWVEAFIDRCAKVIRDFPKIVRRHDSAAEYQVLLRDKSV